VFAFKRILVLVAIVFVAVWIRFGSKLLGSDNLSLGINLAWSGAPFCAGILCLLAANISRNTERAAWQLFGAGCFVWLGGMLLWTGYSLTGAQASFPGLSDVGYLLGTICFIPAMFCYAMPTRADNRIEIWTFVLVASGAALATFALFLRQITASNLSMAGTALALAYPAIWAGAAGTGLVYLLFYAPSRRRLELSLMIAGLLIQGAADLLYGLSLMAGGYVIGSYLDGFWVVAFALFGWAAIERRLRGSETAAHSISPLAFDRHPAEALFAAGIVAAVSIATAMAGALLGKQVALLSIPVALLYAFSIGAREYLALAAERQLLHSTERTVAQLGESRQRLSSVLESTTDSVVVLDRDWRISYFNSRASETVGRERKLEIDRNIWDLFPEEVGGTFDTMYRKAMAAQQPVSLEEYLPSAGVWLEVHAFPSPDSLSLFFRDVSARRQAQDKIMQLAYHDPLTGLANRTLFHDTLVDSLSDGRAQVALMCLDLDHFKEVNDSFGHNVGDLLLKQVARRLAEVIGGAGTLARLGGDEFAILLRGDANAAVAMDLAGRVLTMLSRPFQVEAVTIAIGSSIGIAVFPQQATGSEELFSNADTALYFAKEGGRGRAMLFQSTMTEQVRWKQALRADLAEAAERQQFQVHYQPIVDLATNKITDFEALVRWNHPGRGDVSPSVFIPVAEETGLINKIGDWVLEQACGQAAKWHSGVGISVNLSPCQLRDDELPLRVQEILRRAGLPAGRLSIEITESVLLEDGQKSARLLTALRAMGVRIALDDFGTGYSSLSYLRTFPFDKIKIDRSFVVDLENPTSTAIIRAVVDIGKTLGSIVIAEGIETRQQLDRVRNHGASQAQGYYFSRPVPAEDIDAAARQIEQTAIWWTEKPRRA
jgi:diguanylate cyclase (GGDEF)-like protein/PAS domain S-box-containing protein